MNSNTGMLILGIFLLAYGILCLSVGLLKAPKEIWDLDKIEGFKKRLGDVGTQIFLGVWGLSTAGIGVWLAFLSE
jgi:hypothetical protein